MESAFYYFPLSNILFKSHTFFNNMISKLPKNKKYIYLRKIIGIAFCTRDSSPSKLLSPGSGRRFSEVVRVSYPLRFSRFKHRFLGHKLSSWAKLGLHVTPGWMHEFFFFPRKRFLNLLFLLFFGFVWNVISSFTCMSFHLLTPSLNKQSYGDYFPHTFSPPSSGFGQQCCLFCVCEHEPTIKHLANR